MKKIYIVSLTALALIAFTFGGTSAVSAYAVEPVLPATAESTGFGQAGGRDPGTGTGIQDPILLGDEILHDYIIAAYSDALGIPVEEIESRVDAGETLAEIAIAAGYSLEDFQVLQDGVFATALSEAVADGDITQEQADWLSARGNRGSAGTGMSGLGMQYETRTTTGAGYRHGFLSQNRP
ncbi:MAG: hypothetical protein C0391_06810 [Anaerolinea sp.]|nr:hypothetical protein [Anaerolinea sp.]